VPILLLIMKMVVLDMVIVTIHETVEPKIVIIPKTEEEKEDTTIVTTQEDLTTDMMIVDMMIVTIREEMMDTKMRICRQDRLVVGQEDLNITILTTAEIHMIGIVGIRITYDEGKG